MTPSELNEEHFTPVAGLKLVFEPAKSLKEPSKKHSCPDCHFCQRCSDDRCNTCRGKCRSKQALSRKLSLCEQIALYERINAKH